MKCQKFSHKFQEILLFCLNNNCKTAQACNECIQQIHIKHIYDCFELHEMECILSNELEKIRLIDNNQIQSLQIYVEQIKQVIKQAIEQIKINMVNRINMKEILNIISITKQCYHRQIQHQVLSFILQNFKNQPEIKSNLINQFEEIFSRNILEYQQKRLVQQGYRLFELKKYYESFTFYDRAYKLKYFEVNFIKIYCLVLYLTNKYEQAKDLIKNNTEIFYNNFDLNKQFGFLLAYEKIDEYKKFNYFLRTETGDYQTEHAGVLLQLYKFKECLEIVNEVLKKNPQNERAINVKVEVFLKQGEYGLAKQFVDDGDKRNPKEYLSAKLICITYDRKFFESYSQLMDVEEFKQFAQLIKTFISNEQQEIQGIEKMEQYIKQNKLEQQPQSLVCTLFKDIMQKKQQGYNVKHPRLVEIIQCCSNENFDSALKMADELISAIPYCRFLYYVKSRCYQLQQNFPKGLECAKIAMYLNQEQNHYTRNYAFSLVLNNKIEQALKILDESKFKNEYDILKLKGQILYQTEKLNEALQCFKQMKDLEPNKFETTIMITQTLAKINQYSNNEQENQDSQLMKQDKDKQQFQNMNNPEYLMKINMIFKFDQLFKSIKEEDFMLLFMD